ncbi:uncharacterized protein [Macaca nemestrina]|nr:uncharacterized protein LOC123574506 [Macaca fascicularis]
MQGRKTCAQAGSQEHARVSAPVCAASFLAEDRLPTTDITRPGPGATLTQKTKLHGSEKRSPFLRRHHAGMQAPDSVRSVEVEREAKTWGGSQGGPKDPVHATTSLTLGTVGHLAFIIPP